MNTKSFGGKISSAVVLLLLALGILLPTAALGHMAIKHAVDYSRVEQMLLLHEGLRLDLYQDTVGKWTIGIGRNLEDRGISEEEAYYLLRNDIRETYSALSNKYHWFPIPNDPVRNAVVIDMAFNLGISRFDGFQKTIYHIERRDYSAASEEMLRSKWARQVGQRATRLSTMMKLGEWYEGRL